MYLVYMEEKKYFSIVIPTMWKSDFLKKMLEIYENSELVKEIIIIDNKPEDKFDLLKYKKIIYWTKGENIFVNPAWNIGVKLSNYNLILANDDILIENLNDVLSEILLNEYDIIGISWGQESIAKLTIEQVFDFPINGYGCFMYVKNFINIPNELKIWRGDYIQFINNPKKGLLKNPKLFGDLSKTMKSDPEFRKIGKNDIVVYNNLIEKNKLN